jgi:hypothetical protein
LCAWRISFGSVVSCLTATVEATVPAAVAHHRLREKLHVEKGVRGALQDGERGTNTVL